ncbi:MAG: hypothetical protein GF329_15850 [Candidatus Lokiarchaeota archaeon]|nr:hypothetical protein [Candidatus Lokiarchaeota archaeon]
MSLEVIKSYLTDPTRFLNLDSIQSYKNMVVVPLVTNEEQTIEFRTLLKGEKEGFAYIKEQESETVAQLEAVNKGSVPVLIPFMQTISGGKQDRTVFEPILIPSAEAENNTVVISIPSKCVERSRWAYRARNAPDNVKRQFLSSELKVSPSSSRRALSAKYRQVSEQSEMWDSIDQMRSSLNISNNVARSNSHIEMAKHKEKDIKDYAQHFTQVPGQTGLGLLINGKLVGIELYGNANSFNDFFDEIINSYALEALIRKDKEKNEISENEAYNQILGKFNIDEMEFMTRKGIGLGEIIEFKSKNMNWVGISLTHQNKICHLYIVAETALPGSSAGPESRQQESRVRTSGLNRRFRR